VNKCQIILGRIFLQMEECAHRRDKPREENFKKCITEIQKLTDYHNKET
jgi:hypothetical protein